MEAAVPWADLREELLDRIFSFLPSLADRASCACVCRHWRIKETQREHATPPTLPWLLRPSGAGGTYYRLFSRSSTNVPAVPENARGARFLGSWPGGWFVVARGQWRGYALLNLITGDEVPLPDGVREGEISDKLQVGIEPSDLLILAATRSPALTSDGRYIVAAITLGHHKTVCWSPDTDHWEPLEPIDYNCRAWQKAMLEEFEDVIYRCCDVEEGFYFLTSQEHLVVFSTTRVNSKFDQDSGEVAIDGDLIYYTFPDHRMSSPPEAGQKVAGRYLVESGGRLLMVKRFNAPGRSTVSFQVFRLRWRDKDPYWQRLSVLMGQLLFIGRGSSRAFQTGRLNPGYIYFFDDAEGFHDPSSIVRTGKQYRYSDAGWCSYFTQDIEKSWPEPDEGPPPTSSPWVWLFH
jgi:hypothetical protein